jgi:hypothetical protein
MAKVQGGPIKDEKSSDKTVRKTSPRTVTVASADFMDERGDMIIASLDTTDVNPSVESCSAADPSISLDTPHDPSISLDTPRDPSISIDTPRDPSISPDTPRDPIVETRNLSTANMDEIGDAIIAELDVNTTVNSSTNVDSNEQSCTTMEQDNTNMDTVDHTPSIVCMDEGEDRIIAELDTSEVDACSKDSQANAEIDKIAAMTAEMKKQEFAGHVDKKLTKNISQLKFLGRIIGAAISEGFFINLHLCKALVKQVRIRQMLAVRYTVVLNFADFSSSRNPNTSGGRYCDFMIRYDIDIFSSIFSIRYRYRY